MKAESTSDLIKSIRNKSIADRQRYNKNSIGTVGVVANINESSGKKKVFKKQVFNGVTSIATTRIAMGPS